jgi:predicted aspartyl protease
MKYKIVRFQKLMWRNMIRSTKSKKISTLHYSIDILNKNIYIHTIRAGGIRKSVLVPLTFQGEKNLCGVRQVRRGGAVETRVPI